MPGTFAIPRLLPLLVVGLCAGCSGGTYQPVVIAPPAPPPPTTLADCHPFTAATMEAGTQQHATGTACLQPDGRWLVIEERPLPDAAIAWAPPLPSDVAQEDAVYYAFDPSNHKSSWLDGGSSYRGYYGGYGYGRWGGFHHGFGGFGFGGWRY